MIETVLSIMGGSGMSDPGRHRQPRRRPLSDDVARQAAYLVDHASVSATDLARRLARAGLVDHGPAILVANVMIHRGRSLAGLAQDTPRPTEPPPSIMTVDEQLDALGRGDEVATPLRGMLAIFRDQCRDEESTIGPQFCQCEELIVRVPPYEWPWAQTEAGRLARWSHLDGSPVCPRMGPMGYEPAEPC